MPICGKGHTHPSVSDIRACYATTPAPRVASAPVPPVSAATGRTERHVVFTESEPTPRQMDTIKRLGGVMPTGCTRGQASSIIGQLYARRDAVKAQPVTLAKEPRRMDNGLNFPGSFRFRTGKQFPFPASLMFNMHEARYAVSLDGSDNLTFVRLSIIKPMKNGKPRMFTGCMKMQTQHSDDLIDRFVVEPGGQYLAMSNTMGEVSASQLLAAIVVDQRGAAARYGQRLGMCCRCGKTLTDERSRWYGIGPECEKHWPEIIDESNDERGVFKSSMLAKN